MSIHRSATKSREKSFQESLTGSTGPMLSTGEGLGSLIKPRRLTRDSGSRSRTTQRFSQNWPSIIQEGVDVTPRPLNPYIYEGARERQLSIHDTMVKDSFLTVMRHSLARVDSQKFHANLLQQKQEGETQTLTRRMSYLMSSYGDDLTVGLLVEPLTDSVLSRDIFDKEDEKSIDESKPIPQHISLILKETETFFLLDFPSCTVHRSSEGAEAAEEDNRMYDYLTKGKGRNRKCLNVEIQTMPILLKARDTETDKIRYKNNSTYVSTWEMYDTFQEKAKEEVEVSSSDEDNEENINVDHKLNEEASIQSFRLSAEEKQLNKLIKSQNFFNALLVTERILGNNTYNEEQKRFKGLSDPEPFRENIEYKYRLQLLWTYANEATEGKCVTGVAFNSMTEDIVAVAYGKYFYNDRDATGMVMIWNFKNPQQPERQYNFSHPVTSIAFSKQNPNLLAIGFYNGHIYIVDISKREIAIFKEQTDISFEPVWSILWFQQGDEENIMASFGDGRVCKFQTKPGKGLKSTQIMIVASAEGKIKGIKYLKKCEEKEISINRYDEARCLALHPSEPFTYFVGTSEGIVHRCSTNYYNEHMDLFKTHDGAMHTMKFSPFANKLYCTCGDDFRARLWVDGVHEPLITTEPSIVPVLDIDWSPTHSTIIATIRGSDILVWDMQRKMYEPQSKTTLSKSVFNTVCRFSTNGRCLMVGDMAGNVHVFSVEDLPFPPFFPENLLSMALKKLLVTKPELLKKFRKVGSLCFDKKNASKYFT